MFSELVFLLVTVAAYYIGKDRGYRVAYAVMSDESKRVCFVEKDKINQVLNKVSGLNINHV